MPWLDSDYAILKKRSLGDICEKVKQCTSLRLQNCSEEFVADRVAAAINGYVKNILTLEISDTPFFRARKCQNGNSWKNISDLWYNPDRDEIPFGRANFPKQQILYLASNVDVAVAEIRAEIGQIVNVLECRVAAMTKRISTIDFLIFEPEILSRLKINHKGKRVDLEQELGRHEFLKNNAILKFISNEFKKTVNVSHDYKVTASIANNLWLKEENDESLVYPSIVTNYNGYNLALKHDFADTALNVVKIGEFQVKEIINGLPTLTFLKQGKLESGSAMIKWE